MGGVHKSVFATIPLPPPTGDSPQWTETWVLPKRRSNSSQTAPASVPPIGCNPSGRDCPGVGPVREIGTSVSPFLHGCTDPARSLLQGWLSTWSQPPLGVSMGLAGDLHGLQWHSCLTTVSFLNTLSQRCYHHFLMSQSWPVLGQCWHWLALVLSHKEGALLTNYTLVAPPVSEACHAIPIQHASFVFSILWPAVLNTDTQCPLVRNSLLFCTIPSLLTG